MELITEKIKNFETEEYAKAYGRAIGLKYDTEVVLVAGEKVVLCGTSYPSEEDISQDIEDLFNRLKGEYQIEGSNSDDCDVINRVTKIISEYFEKGYGLKFVNCYDEW